jgi:hypothetical protein
MRTGPTSEVSCPRFFCAQHLKQMYDGTWCYGRQPGSSLQALWVGAHSKGEGPARLATTAGPRTKKEEKR